MSKYFNSISNKYNFPVEDRNELFIQSIINENSLARVLDIGCGNGIAGESCNVIPIRKKVSEFWGIDPAIKKNESPQYFDKFQQATLESADLPEDYFDVAYSFMVMEHINNPQNFFKHLHNVLRLGGVYIFMTPNPRSFFGRCAKLSHRMGISNQLLSILRNDTEYHHQLTYPLDSEEAIKKAACDFECSFVYSEPLLSMAGYLPGPFRIIDYAINAKRHIWKKKKSLQHMIVRCVKNRAY